MTNLASYAGKRISEKLGKVSLAVKLDFQAGSKHFRTKLSSDNDFNDSISTNWIGNLGFWKYSHLTFVPKEVKFYTRGMKKDQATVPIPTGDSKRLQNSSPPSHHHPWLRNATSRHSDPPSRTKHCIDISIAMTFGRAKMWYTRARWGLNIPNGPTFLGVSVGVHSHRVPDFRSLHRLQ